MDPIHTPVGSKIIKFESIDRSKKNLSYVELSKLIKQLTSNDEVSQPEEVVEELGLVNEESVEIDNLIEILREKRKSSKYISVYDNILNLFVTPGERIMNILHECCMKLASYNELCLVRDLKWVIQKINNDDIYNINLDLINEINSDSKGNNDINDTMKLISEYSTDCFNKNKKEDIKVARTLSDKRMTFKTRRSSLMNLKPSTFLPKASIQMALSPQPRFIRKQSDRDQQFHLVPIGTLSNESKTRFTMKEDFNITPIKASDVTEFECKDENNLIKLNPTEPNYISNDSSESVDGITDSPSTLVKSDRFKRISVGNINNLELNLTSSTSIIDDVDFDIFNYSKNFGRENVLINIANSIFENYSFYTFINYQRFETFVDKIRLGYDYLLPYHNDLHATDVLQTCHLFVSFSNLKSELDLTMLDLCGLFISAIIHDYKHPGLNNNYHINKRSPFAIRYNDISVLENYHVSAAFKVISHNNSNIFCELSVEEYRIIRKRIVECVLATDMAKHTKSMTSLKIKIDQIKNDLISSSKSILSLLINNVSEDTKFDRQQEILNYFIHCSDISNPGKKFPIAKVWTDLIMDEFFSQGELEKKETLPVSFLCDRDSTNIPRSQVMFITNIVMPCFKLLTQLSSGCAVFLSNMNDNVERWKMIENENKAKENK